MAIIDSYPKATITENDLLLGTQVDGGNNATKTFSMQDIIDLTVANVPQGPQGPQGAKGDQGIQGLKGDQGIQGIQGVIGDTGDRGDKGDQGVQGVQGPMGLPGLYAQTANSVPVVNASGEATLIGTGVGVLSVPANGFSIGDSFTAKLCGQLSCANNETLRIRIRSNGLVIMDAAVFTLAISTNKFWDLILDFTIRNIGGAGVGSLSTNGVFTYNKNANSSIDGVHFGQINNTVFDTTVTNTLTITAEWTSVHATNTISSQNFTLTKVY
jgi:hypothetical protein